jgi:hypothetical protein
VACWEFTHLGKGILDEQPTSDHDDQHRKGTVLPAQRLRVGLPTCHVWHEKNATMRGEGDDEEGRWSRGAPD